MSDRSIDETLPLSRRRFQLQELLGRGGMGVVYQAHDSLLDRRVAVKIVNRERIQGEKGRELLHREARTTAALEHENIVRVYDHLQEADCDLIVMEYLEGETLADRLIRGPLSPEEVIRLALDLLEGLGHAHGQGFLHRDLKPSNIWLTPSGKAKILDFGLAKSLKSRESSFLGGRVVGTPAYMAPEQLGGGRSVRQSDLFSLGIVLYEALTGDAPFRGEQPDELVSNVLLTQYRRVSRLRPDLPELADAIDRLLARRPRDRPSSAIDAAMLIERCRQTRQPISAVRLSPHRAAMSLMVLSLLAALGSLLFSSNQAAEPSSVAVSAFVTDQGDLDWMAFALEERLRFHLEASGRFQVIGRHRLSQREDPVDSIEDFGEELLRTDELIFIEVSPVRGSDSGTPSIHLRISLRSAMDRSEEPILVRGDPEEWEALLVESTARVSEHLGLSTLPDTELQELLTLLPRGEPGRLYARGLSAQSSYSWASARDLFQEAMGEAPENPLIGWALARAERRLGRHEHAVEAGRAALRSARSISPSVAEEIEIFLGIVTRDWQTAVQVLRKRIDQRPSRISDGALLATCLRELEDPTGADRVIEQLRGHAKTPVDDVLLDFETTANAFQLGRFREVVSISANVADRARELGKRSLSARARLFQSMALDLIGNSAGANAAFSKAEKAFVEAADSKGLVDSLTHHVAMLARQGNTSSARRQFETHRDVYKRLGDSYQVARISVNLGKILIDQGDFDGAIELLDGAGRWFQQEERILEGAMVAIDLGAAEQLRGSMRSAKEHYQRALEVFKQSGQDAMSAAVMTNLGELAYLRGDLESALRLHRQALAINSRLRLPSGEAYDHRRIAMTLHLQGRFSEAADHFETAISLQDSLEEAAELGQTQIALARFEIDRKNFGSAVELARFAAAALRQAGMTDQVASAQIVEAEALLRQPDPEISAARSLLESAQLHAQVSQNRELRLRTILLHWKVVLAEGGELPDSDFLESANSFGYYWIVQEAEALLSLS